MAKIVVSEFVTVDGVAEDPGGAEDNDFGGWSFKFDRGPEGDKFKLDEVMAADALLLGRLTYEGFAKAWPSMSNEFADKMNNMRKYVLSSTLEHGEWTNTVVIHDLSELAGLKEQHSGDLLVNGSMRLAQALLDAGLIDELRLMIHPIVLGRGKRLFADSSETWPLRTVAAEQMHDVVTLTFESASVAS
jgi:dihydrofolate reductase